MIREAFVRGLSTRAVGRVVALITEEAVRAQTVSRLTRDLDQAVAQFPQAPLTDDWRDLFLDGVSLRVRRPGGRKRVQLFVAYGVRADGTRHLLAFTRSTRESQAAWEGLVQDLYRRGLEGRPLQLIVTDGCAGLAAALQTSYPRRGASAVLGPHAAQSAGGGAATRSGRGQSGCPGHLSRRQPDGGGEPGAGARPTRRWFAGSFRICPSCSRSSRVPGRCGDGCGRRT